MTTAKRQPSTKLEWYPLENRKHYAKFQGLTLVLQNTNNGSRGIVLDKQKDAVQGGWLFGYDRKEIIRELLVRARRQLVLNKVLAAEYKEQQQEKQKEQQKSRKLTAASKAGKTNPGNKKGKPQQQANQRRKTRQPAAAEEKTKTAAALPAEGSSENQPKPNPTLDIASMFAVTSEMEEKVESILEEVMNDPKRLTLEIGGDIQVSDQACVACKEILTKDEVEYLKDKTYILCYACQAVYRESFLVELIYREKQKYEIIKCYSCQKQLTPSCEFESEFGRCLRVQMIGTTRCELYGRDGMDMSRLEQLEYELDEIQNYLVDCR